MSDKKHDPPLRRGSEAKRGASAYAHPPEQQHRRRGRVIAVLIATIVLFFIFSSTSAVNEVSSIAKDASRHLPKRPKMPSLSINPFSQAVHKPPEQKNSSSGDSKWYADWKWLNPFSSTITLDDTRSVLPPLPERPHIYTYYDIAASKDSDVKKEEHRLLQVWRRAWWAQGFRPVILGKAEAMKNPYFETMQKKKLSTSLEGEMMRWLAWGHMGDGILSNWLVVPMAARDDLDLSYLRRGDYPGLTRYEDMGGGFFAGPSHAIATVVKAVLDAPNIEGKKTIFEAISNQHLFAVQPRPPGIAFYESRTISKHYSAVAGKLEDSKVQGLRQLSELITSHLHGTFLEANCKKGFNVLIAKPTETLLLSAPAARLAHALNECPPSPIEHSCPPNIPNCTPCAAVKIYYRPSIHNVSHEFTIGTIPHPYTQAVLTRGAPKDADQKFEDLTVRYVRRETERDPWLGKATEQVLPRGLSAYQRIVHFKDWIVTDAGQTRGIWHTAERDWRWDELEWRLGFALPGHNGTIELPQPTDARYPEVLDPMIAALAKRPTRKDILAQADLFDQAKHKLAKTRFHTRTDMRRVVEAWNLADTEAWRFVRAFEARARVERDVWLAEEKRYLGAFEDDVE